MSVRQENRWKQTNHQYFKGRAKETIAVNRQYLGKLEQEVANSREDTELLADRLNETRIEKDKISLRLEQIEEHYRKKLAAKDREIAELFHQAATWQERWKNMHQRFTKTRLAWQKVSIMWNCIYDEEVKKQAELTYSPCLKAGDSEDSNSDCRGKPLSNVT